MGHRRSRGGAASIALRRPPRRAARQGRWTGRPGVHWDDGGLTDARTLRTIGQLSTIGLAFVFALVMGFAGGYWLDGLLGTKPWLSLLGFGLGLAAGILNVVRTMRIVSAPDPPSAPGPGRDAGNRPAP